MRIFQTDIETDVHREMRDPIPTRISFGENMFPRSLGKNKLNKSSEVKPVVCESLNNTNKATIFGKLDNCEYFPTSSSLKQVYIT